MQAQTAIPTAEEFLTLAEEKGITFHLHPEDNCPTIMFKGPALKLIRASVEAVDRHPEHTDPYAAFSLTRTPWGES